MELAIMGGVEDKRRTPLADGEQFIAVMGGIDIDLTQAPMGEQMNISALAFMGGVKLTVPRGVEVTFAGFAIMGARTFKRAEDTSDTTPHEGVTRALVPTPYARLHINAVALMGAIEVVEV